MRIDSIQRVEIEREREREMQLRIKTKIKRYLPDLYHPSKLQ